MLSGAASAPPALGANRPLLARRAATPSSAESAPTGEFNTSRSKRTSKIIHLMSEITFYLLESFYGRLVKP